MPGLGRFPLVAIPAAKPLQSARPWKTWAYDLRDDMNSLYGGLWKKSGHGGLKGFTGTLPTLSSRRKWLI